MTVVFVDFGVVAFAGASEVAGSAVEIAKGHELIRTPAFIELPFVAPVPVYGLRIRVMGYSGLLTFSK
jgi:hypothetical protein